MEKSGPRPQLATPTSRSPLPKLMVSTVLPLGSTAMPFVRHSWQEQRPLVPERWTVPISKDGNYVFIDGPGDVELDHDGKMRKHLGAIVDAWEALPGGRSRPTPKIGDFP